MHDKYVGGKMKSFLTLQLTVGLWVKWFWLCTDLKAKYLEIFPLNS